MPFGRWKERARYLKTEMVALYLAARHPQTPWYAKVVVAGVVAYAVTPVDFFPDVLPVLGFVDDLIFIPLALAVAVKFVPSPVLAECRGRAPERIALQGRSSWVLITTVWLALAAAGIALHI
jgi:uncharacterized membrane protein YkvA (DUF1232 family)